MNAPAPPAEAAPAWPVGTGLVWLDEVDSTNAEAARRAAAGEPGPLWIAARRQTAGRGRLGRSWAMPEGNLAATLLLRPACAPAEAALMSFTAAVATARLLREAGIDTRQGLLKWPNDVLVRGAKIAGILLESHGTGERVDWLAIGIGINLAHAPPPGAIRPGGRAPTSLAAETGRRLAPQDAIAALARHITALSDLQAARGFAAAIRPLWLAEAAHLGQPVTAGDGANRLSGVFSDMDEAGRLVLDMPGRGRRLIASGDIHVPD